MRAFWGNPQVVVRLAGALIGGLRAAGTLCCGKHFCGHGGVKADTHVALLADPRLLDEIATDESYSGEASWVLRC